MRITNLELKNFGQHKHINADFDSHIVGLMGANGSGKTTIQKAIEMACNGTVSDGTGDAMSTYIRDFGSENAAKSFTVVMDFIVNGQAGKVTRSATATSSTRELQWDGNRYTKASEVDSLMRELIGADKKAFADLVCVQQGELDKLLSGTDSERRDLFVKLLQLGHMDKSSKLCAGHRKSLQSNCLDLSSIRDDATEAVTEALEDSAAARRSLQSLPDLSEDIVKATSLNVAVVEKARTSKLSIHAASDCTTASAATHVTQDSLVSAKSALSSVKDKLLTLESRRKQAEQAEATINRLKSRDIAIAKKKDIESSIAALGLSEEDYAALPKKIQDAKDAIEINKRSEEARVALAAIVADTPPEVVACPMTSVAIVTADASLHKALGNEAVAQQAVKVYSNIGDDACQDTKCPVCRQTFGAGVNIADLRAQAERELEEAVRESSRARELLAEARAAQDKENAAIQAYKADKVARDMRAAQYEAIIKPEVPTLSREELSECISVLKVAEDLNRSLYGVSVEIQGYDDIKDSIEDLQAVVGDKPTEDIHALQTSMMADEMLVRDMEAQLQNLEMLRNKCATAEQDAHVAEMRMQEVYASVVESSQHICDALNARVDGEEEFVMDSRISSEIISDMRSKQDARVRALAELSAKEGVLEAAQERLDAVTVRIEAQKVTLKVVEELEEFERVMRPSGVASTYIDYKFRKIAAVTQDFLSSMGANFVVFPAEDKPVAFSFIRTDRAEGVTMPQTKLSGGEKIRLAVAFLMAIHDTVIPEVGLLLLDEPSTHLDEEGVLQLLEMLQTLGQRCDTTGAQVIVCDHNVLLTPAFGKTINVKATK